MNELNQFFPDIKGQKEEEGINIQEHYLREAMRCNLCGQYPCICEEPCPMCEEKGEKCNQCKEEEHGDWQVDEYMQGNNIFGLSN